jgi:hypothetical protein
VTNRGPADRARYNDFVNNISLYAIIISHLVKSDFNTLKGIFLGKVGINNSI